MGNIYNLSMDCYYLLRPNDLDTQLLESCFSTKITDLDQFRELYFIKKYPFYSILEKKNPEEFQKFFDIYENLRTFILNYKNMVPIKNLSLLETKTIKRKVELKRKEVALIFILSFFDLINIEQNIKNNSFIFSPILSSKDGAKFHFGRCFLNYLINIGKWLGENNKILDETIIYARQNIEESDIYEKDIDLCDVNIIEKGSLFDGVASYCVDFANKYIGGGVLRGGSVQEEILFAIDPEATVSMFFMEVMDKNDAIGIFNTIQYSNYKGYGRSFKFDENAIPEDLTKIKKHRIIAIDAIPNFKQKGLLDQKDIMRDIHKAYVGFNLVNFEKEVKTKETKKNEKSEKEKEIEKGKEKEKEKEEDKGKGKEKDKGKEKGKEKEKEKGKEKGKEEDKGKDKEKGKERGAAKGKEKDKGKEKEKDKEKGKVKEKGKEEDKGKVKEKVKVKDKEKNESSNNVKAIEKSISTGNWGCGVFGGNHVLKFIQQWIAASFAGVKRLDYYTFEKNEMKIVIQRLDDIKNKYKKANELYNAIVYNQISDNNIIDVILENDINK